MLENASLLEVGWSLSALVGVATSVALLWLYLVLENRRRLAGIEGGVKHDIHKSLASATGKTVTSLCFLIAGLIAMQTPPNPLAESDPDAAIGPVLIGLLFILANISTSVSAAVGLLQHELSERALRGAVEQDRRSADAPQTVDEYTDTGGASG